MSAKPLTKQTFLQAGHHCRHCGMEHQKGLRRANHKDPERLKDEVLDILREAVAKDLLHCGKYVTREAIAAHLEVPEHQVERALQLLRVEGYVGAPEHQAPHDSTRDPWGGNDSAWAGSSYPVRKEKFEAEAPKAPRPKV